MLRKLLKYELKATGRLFLPLYGALVIFALFNSLLLNLNSYDIPELPTVIGVTIYACLIMAIFVLTFVVMIQRFYKNLLSDEGYLMFTLPLKTWQLVASKLLTSILWVVASAVVTGFTLFIMALNVNLFTEIPYAFRSFTAFLVQYVGVNEIVFVLESLLAGLLSLARFTLMIYASISLGHLLERWRMLGAFGAFLGLSVADQIVNALLNVFTNQPGFFPHEIGMSGVSHLVLLTVLLSALFWSAIYFAITSYVLSRKLNLE